MAASTSQIRRSFLKFFASASIPTIPPSPAVPKDASLLFTPAGMVQFKDVFEGATHPSSFLDASGSLGIPPAVATAQPCVRAGGKHNDLDEVGLTPRHHTYFEMLGNFVFGAASPSGSSSSHPRSEAWPKDEALQLAWRYLTTTLSLPPDRLFVTVHTSDDTAAQLWRDMGVPPSRILRLGDADNFWAAGDSGPCGPCSEIFWLPDGLVDKGGSDIAITEEVAENALELWNVVFMESAAVDGVRSPLPAVSIDTGMGLERLASVVQGVESNFAIDVFANPIGDMRNIVAAHGGPRGEAAADAYSVLGSDPGSVAFRVLADHLRCLSYLISESVLPSPSSRGYVVRRILRRAVLAAHSALGMEDVVALPLLAPPIIAQMGADAPAILDAKDLILSVLEEEEVAFRKTLSKGLSRLDTALSSAPSGSGVLDGNTVFTLYDTYGFPPDMTQALASAKGVDIDWSGYQAALETSRQTSAADANANSAAGKARDSALAHLDAQLQGRKDGTEFCVSGSEMGKVVTRLASYNEGTTAYLVVDRCPLYAEGGGQVADLGVARCPETGASARVVDVQKHERGGSTFAVVTVEGEEEAVRALSAPDSCSQGECGGEIELVADAEHRESVAAHHSATHLLHGALREMHGPDAVAQAGSWVGPDRLRFDVTASASLDVGELEARVNQAAGADVGVETEVLPFEDAVSAGAVALFGEKYDPSGVRMVSMGPFSRELCGGTHVSSTAHVSPFVILGERGIGAGVRRIEAVAGKPAVAYLMDQWKTIRAGCDAAGIPADAAKLAEYADRAEGQRVKAVRSLKALQKSAAGSRAPVLSPSSGQALTLASGDSIVVHSIDKGSLGLEPDAKGKALKAALQASLRSLTAEDDTAVHVLLCDGVVATGAPPSLSASSVLQSLFNAVGGGRGGGSPKYAQGMFNTSLPLEQLIRACERPSR